jgi:two-component system sensor histidine kinase/response regulator
MAAGWLIVAVLGLYLGTHDRSSAVSQTLGDGSIFAFSLLAALACARAARARSSSRSGWLLLTFSLSLWSAAQLTYSLYGVTSQHVYPFPSIADVWFLAYSIPALAGLFAFPRPDALLVSRVRGLFDALVIATATIFVSWATVLEPTHSAFGLDATAGLTALAYPVVDVTICSIVLTLGMRQPPGERLLWVLLGGGLLVLAISDSVYVRLLAEGETAITGSALAVGWMAAFLLIIMATFVNAPRRPSPSQTSSSFGLQLIPYVPLVAAVIVATGAAYRREPFHALTGGLLLVIVIARQLVIVYENVTLTRDLEGKVVARTAELHSVNEIVKAKNEQMEAAQAIARVGSWEWRPAVGETKWSPEFYRILGLPANCTDTQSDLFMERVHPEDMAKVLDARAEVLRNPTDVQTEYRIIRPDGSIRHVQSRVAVVRDAAHDAPMLVGTMQDLTELFEVERMKDQFLSVASHELRTPLTSIRGVLGLLAGGALGPLSDQAQRMVGVAVGSSERLVRLISGILDAEKIEAGKLSLDLAEYPAAELVAAAVDEMAPLAHESGVTLNMLPAKGRSVLTGTGSSRR